MQIDIFPTSIFIENIDANLINVKSEQITKQWMAETPSSHGNENQIEKESLNYLHSKLTNMLSEKYKTPFQIKLNSIWINKYENSDFQEAHIHPGHQYSFIIYKEINESRTIFFRPSRYLVNCFFEEKVIPTIFKPSLRSNQIILFPSYLEHMVQKTDSGTTIAGNISLNVE